MHKHIINASPESTMNTIVTIGIDLAKNVFAIHGVNSSGKPILVRPSVRREQLLDMLAQLPPCLIGMEACSGAHHWVRHIGCKANKVKTMRMMPRLFAKRSRDLICALCRSNWKMRNMMTVHRVCHGFIEERTATINRIRGLMSEFGSRPTW